MKLASDTISVNRSIKIRNVPNNVIVRMKVAKPKACLKNRFSGEKNISPVATDPIYIAAKETGIPIKGDLKFIELNIIAPEKVRNRASLVHFHPEILLVLFFEE